MARLLPIQLVCITLEHVIDDLDAIEGYLATDPQAVETCMPIIIHRMLDPSAHRYGLLPSTLTPDMLWRVLQTMWTPSDKHPLAAAAANGALYLIPYIIKDVMSEPWEQVLSEAAANGHINVIQFVGSLMNTYFDPKYYAIRILYMTTAAARNGQIGVLDYLSGIMEPDAYYKRLPRIIEDAAPNGQADVVDYAFNLITRGRKVDTKILTTMFNQSSNLDRILSDTAHKKTASSPRGEEGYARVARTLLKYGADPTYRNYQALRHTAYSGNMGVLRELLRADPTIIKAPIASEVLITAIDNGTDDVINFLLDSGINIHTDRENALIHAVEKENVPLVRRLLERASGRKPADIHARGDSLLWMALNNGDPNMIQALLDAGAGKDIIAVSKHLPHSWGQPHYVEAVELLLHAARKMSTKSLKDTNTIRELTDDLAGARRNRAEREARRE